MDIRRITEYCQTNLDLQNVQLDQVYFYQSLPLCVIDAVFSIGVTYRSTELTVQRFCEHFNLRLSRGEEVPPREEQLSIQDFIKIYDELGVEGMAEQVYQNHQRTSPRGGILKAEAVLKFSRTLVDFGVNYFQDMGKVMGLPNFEQAIFEIPGQHSGISLRYFYMLVGNRDFIKPDRMIKRFLFAATGENLSDDECQQALLEVCEILKQDQPALTPRALDNLIWNYQRNIR